MNLKGYASRMLKEFVSEILFIVIAGLRFHYGGGAAELFFAMLVRQIVSVQSLIVNQEFFKKNIVKLITLGGIEAR